MQTVELQTDLYNAGAQRVRLGGSEFDFSVIRHSDLMSSICLFRAEMLDSRQWKMPYIEDDDHCMTDEQ